MLVLLLAAALPVESAEPLLPLTDPAVVVAGHREGESEIPDWIRQVRLAGFVQVDGVGFDQDAGTRQILGDLEDIANIRRARVILSGPITDRIDYRFGLDFGGPGRPSFLDTRIDIGLFGTSAADPIEPVTVLDGDETEDEDFLLLRLGRAKQPQSMSALESSAELLFLERATPLSQAVVRELGATFWGTALSRRVSYGIGGYRNDGNVFGAVSGDAGYGLAGRVTTSTIGESALLHLAASGVVQSNDDGMQSFSARPGVGFNEFDFADGNEPAVPAFIDTGNIAVDRTRQLGLEAGLRIESLLLRGELLASRLDRDADPTAQFWGYFVEAAYCLTGEIRPYNRAFGFFGGITPDTVVLDGGLGAIELAARYETTDFTDADIRGGRLGVVTLGANWFWSDRLKWQANAILSETDRDGVADARTNIYAVRMQFRF